MVFMGVSADGQNTNDQLFYTLKKHPLVWREFVCVRECAVDTRLNTHLEVALVPFSVFS